MLCQPQQGQFLFERQRLLGLTMGTALLLLLFLMLMGPVPQLLMMGAVLLLMGAVPLLLMQFQLMDKVPMRLESRLCNRA